MRFLSWAAIALSSLAFIACTHVPHAERPVAELQAPTIAWSLRYAREDMVVKVSPAGRNLRVGGTAAFLIGSSVDAVANDRYRRVLDDAVDGYDMAGIFEHRLEETLRASHDGELQRVRPPGSSAGYASREEASRMRLAELADAGADLVLDLKVTYGLFGQYGDLVTQIEGDLYTAADGRRVWYDTITVTPGPIIATERQRDPTKRTLPNFRDLRLTAEDGAVRKWHEDGGEAFSRRFEESVRGAVAALLCDVGISRTSEGEYRLGRVALQENELEQAVAHFREAIRLDPDHRDARNGLAYALARRGDRQEAIRHARALTAAAPEYGPGWLTLAWIGAIEVGDVQAAREPYRRALALDMPRSRQIEMRLD